MKKFDICIIGGLGHVGLPLGIIFASKGLKVCLNDVNKGAAELVSKGEMPYVEYGAKPLLNSALKKKNLSISLNPKTISESKYVIVAIGTPVDEYLNPKIRQFLKFFESIRCFLDQSQTIIIRSSVYPSTCKQILNVLGNKDNWKLAYCPERIVQGYAVKELPKLPQIVAGFSKEAIDDASDLFKIVSKKIILAKMGEAELVKLFSNSWRYIQFAIANQFYMMSNDSGNDYDKIRDIMIDGYDRAEGLPTAGFAAGPCLLKDTMQLSSFYDSHFLLGQAAMNINEGLPNYIIKGLKTEFNLSKKKVGILGMAFKGNVDDIRDSLSFKIGKILRFEGSKVYYSDEYAKNKDFCSKEILIEKSDIIIIGSPHSNYKNLKIPEGKKIIDLWNII